MGVEIKNGCLERYTEESGITEVVIPDEVTEIEDAAFESCKNLISITLPDGLTEMGWYVFLDCENIKEK